jgi:hypothetical protein
MPKLVKNLGKIDVFPIFATSYHQGHQGTIPVLGNNGNLCKTSSFHPKTWKTSIFGISWGMPKPMKNLGKWMFSHIFATVGPKKSEKLESQTYVID